MPIADAKTIMFEKAEKLEANGKIAEAVTQLLEIPNCETYYEVCLKLGQLTEKLGDKKESQYYFSLAYGINPSDELKQKLESREKENKQEDKEELSDAEKDEIENNKKIKEQFMPKAIKPTETFNDVIGMDKVKERINEKIMVAIKRPDLFEKYDKQKTAGILLYGSPGVGKTLLMKATANEANVKFIEVKIPEVVSKWTGDSEKHIQAIFDNAAENAPCILFFDEIDSLAQKRDALSGEGSAVVLKQAVEVFLSCMDGMSSKKTGIYAIGTTNVPWDIDSAMKRPGRFGDSIYVNLPNYKERKKLFEYYLKKIKVPFRVNYGRLARATYYYSPADIKEICEDVKTKAIAYEYKTKHQKTITTANLLVAAYKRKATSLNWFGMIKKELISVKSVDKVNGKEVRHEKQGKFTKTEKEEYKPLIDDLNNYINHKDMYRVLRFVALFLF